jgi:spore coat protein U-like protein
MPVSPFRRALIALGLCLAALLCPGRVMAQTYGSCTVAASNMSLGNAGSFTVAAQQLSASGSSGLACSAISVATVSYLKVRLESSTLQLTGPTGQTIPFSVFSSINGAAIPVGAETDFSSLDLLNLFAGPGGTVPLYIKTTATSGLAAGTYTGTVNVRWYFSVCSLGVAVCLSYSQSPGLVRPTLIAPTINWGTGVLATINISLTVEKDCAITAPDIGFGSAPLVGDFNPVTRTISIRCSADASYSVGLSDGDNVSGGARRMRLGQTSSYLRYEIYKGASGTNRWGVAGGERRSSATADTNPGIYDASTLQGFTYRAVVDPNQATPPAGTYTDRIIVDVAF